MIGVFDSGFGGLTILRNLQKALPQYDYLYLGDNARAPYGSRTFETIFRYTLQGLGQSVVPTIAGIMELVMRTAAAIFLCASLGYLGACLANPMAWIGSCVPLAIAFYWTSRSFKKKYNRG